MWQLLFFPLQMIENEISFLGSKFVVFSLTTDSCSLSFLFFHFLILFSIHSGGYQVELGRYFLLSFSHPNTLLRNCYIYKNLYKYIVNIISI